MTETQAPSYIALDGSVRQLPDTEAGAAVFADDRAHVFHSWSAQGSLAPIPVAGGAGATFWDYEGREFLDFGAQLVNLNLGHQHPDLIAAIHRQADRLATIQPAMANDVRGQLAGLITDAAGDSFTKVFFTNAGADANEYAVRLARHSTGRNKVLSTYRSYHGGMGTPIGLTGDPRRWANEAAANGVVHFFGPYPYRSPFYSSSPQEETERALAHLESVIQLEGPGTIAAIILETIVGTNGILVPPPGYLPGVRELCDRYGIVYIADEVMAGFGRTGEWFGFQGFGVTPDLITFAKGVNSGYVPLGGVVISAKIADFFSDKVFYGGLTYSGHPLGCAVGVATFEVFRRDGILEHVREVSETVVAPRLQGWLDTHPSVGEVRGRGLFWAIELVKDRVTREPLVPFNPSAEQNAPMAAFAAACKAGGVWPFVHYNRTHICPPLVITTDELNRGLDVIDEALTTTDQAMGAR